MGEKASLNERKNFRKPATPPWQVSPDMPAPPWQVF